MAQTLTIRGVPPDLARRLEALGRARGQSINSVVLQVLGEALGSDARAERLRRYATWSEEDRLEFEEALGVQRVIDERLWS